MKSAFAFIFLLSAGFPLTASADSKIVTGKDAVKANAQLEKSGLIQDGVSTPQGPASRVFGTVFGKPAFCDFPWHQTQPLQCSIDSSIDLSAPQLLCEVSVIDQPSENFNSNVALQNEDVDGQKVGLSGALSESNPSKSVSISANVSEGKIYSIELSDNTDNSSSRLENIGSGVAFVTLLKSKKPKIYSTCRIVNQAL